ncbi:ribonuclease [Rhizobium sp. Root564]|uniref:YihY/virulence factor BrkB family protein n=2 Tax=Rhizobiaceae TaxID=82115 RepID=A0AA92HA63_RHIRH|nr:ribonuclease [Rhizobium sp. Root564]PVE55576.1 YihY/virulence factor BrkB family protein [Rhizobium rhizogenes]PVE65501.1 YihY/virulence factor BrkB family protein [Agrobacterium tumefaciens]PVE75565.1 YihY/virulence factor BrkB family protein [Sphingomonas sp. TPD3009]
MLERSMSDDTGGDRGRDAEAPQDIPAKGLRDVFWRVVKAIMADRVTLIAAGVTYFMLLSLFPALGALVALYGFVADPTAIMAHIGFLAGVFPPGSFDLIMNQLTSLTQQATSTRSLAFFGGLLVAIWSANSGMKALFDAMNVAYQEDEKRSLVRLNLLSLGFTFCALVVAIILIAAIGVLPAVLKYLWLDDWQEFLARLARWPFIILVFGCGISMIYRYGPSREEAKIKWLSWGVVFSTVLWLVASVLFSFYLENFANYNATYGTLGALIGLMVWVWISVVILIVGAEINAELEHQTRKDSTTGSPKPMGERGAYVADTVGEAVRDGSL